MRAWALDRGREELVAVHGGPGAGGLPPGTVDFSVNTNPFGPAPLALEAWVRADPAAYPDPVSRDACEAAARLWGVHADHLRFSGGATALLHDVALAWLEPGAVGVVPEPCFAEYARAVTIARGRAVRIPPADDSGSLDLDATLRAAVDLDARMVFLGRPNTPTGEVVPDDVLADFTAGLPPGCLLVLDESFLSFHERTVSAPPALGVRPRVVGVRSITKDCGLAGLRAGFAVAPEDLLRALDRIRRPWCASSPAQAAARASLVPESVAWLDGSLRRVAKETDALGRALREAGLEARPSRTGFLCARVPEPAGVVDGGHPASGGAEGAAMGPVPRAGADALAEALAERGLRVRRCASFGLPQHLRFGARLPKENLRLVAALRALRGVSGGNHPSGLSVSEASR